MTVNVAPARAQSIDSILLCFCEDKKRGESTKQYFMSDELLKIVDSSAASERAKSEAVVEGKPTAA